MTQKASLQTPRARVKYLGSAKSGTHHAWLPSGRWGLENVANLDQVPASGATLVVGAPKVKGATGGLTRLFALV